MPTNITDLTNFVAVEVWALWEEQFTGFSDQAGFANSIFEKYVLLPSGINLPLGTVLTEMVLMNAKPFLDEEMTTNRWVIHRIENHFYQSLLREDKLQTILREAGMKVPESAAMVSAVQLDAPRRQEELEWHRSADEALAELERKQNNPKPPPTRFPRRSVEQEKEYAKTNQPSPDGSNPASAIKPLYIVLVVLLATTIGLFTLRRK